MVKFTSAAPFHKNILLWYTSNRRHLPWRKTRQPYRILLSEIMSQQTQVSRVAQFYRDWIKIFPSFSSVANASAADILRAWSGLGYNSRALRFHRLSKIVAEEYRSHLPEDPDELQTLPGIGRYTAHAVACFAFGKNIPVVDVNIKRVITRWTMKSGSESKQFSENNAWYLAEKFLPKKNAVEWNQALMDFGALICSARNPRCCECPVSSYCVSAFSKVFLVKKKKKDSTEPVWRGIPRRLYRGRILKLLHHHSCSPREIAAMLWNNQSEQDVVWTASLMERMTGDGLLTFRRGKYSIIQ